MLLLAAVLNKSVGAGITGSIPKKPTIVVVLAARRVLKSTTELPYSRFRCCGYSSRDMLPTSVSTSALMLVILAASVESRITGISMLGVVYECAEGTYRNRSTTVKDRFSLCNQVLCW